MATYHNQIGVNIGPEFIPYSSNLCGPFRIGSYLYFVASDNTGVQVLFSANYGVSWQVADSAHQPSGGAGISAILANDGTTIIAFYAPNQGDNLRFRNFDTKSGLWNVADYGVAGGPVQPNTGGDTTVFQKSDGKLTVLFSAGGHSSLITVQTYDIAGDAWGAPSNACANIVTLPDWDAAQTEVNNNYTTLFSDDNIYLFFHTDSFITSWEFRGFFQLILTDNSTPAVNFYDFPGNETNPPDLQINNNKFGIPCLVRGFVYLPIGRTDLTNFPGGNVSRASSYWGEVIPGVSQTWTELSANGGSTDPGYGKAPDYDISFEFDNLCNSMGQSFYDGKLLYYVYTGTANQDASILGNDQIRLLYCDPFSDDPDNWVWTGLTVQQIASYNLGSDAYFLFVTILVTGNYVMLSSTIFDNDGNPFTYWYGNFGPTPPVYFAPVPPSISLPFECCMDFHLGCQLKV